MSELVFGSTGNPKASGKEWHGRGYPQYDPEIHIPMVEEIFGNGGGLRAFLGAAEISAVSFYNWLKRYPEFKRKYDVALNRGAAIWELMPLDAARAGVNINFNYWAMIWRQRYNQSAIKLRKEEADNPAARLKAAWNSLRKGGITPQEFNQIASGLATESRVAEVELQKQALENSKQDTVPQEVTDEAIKAFMAALMKGKTEAQEAK